MSARPPRVRVKAGAESRSKAATRGQELNSCHHISYYHGVIPLTQPPTPEWSSAPTDVNRFIDLYPGHDREAYIMRAWIHNNLGNYEATERYRQLAR